MRERIFETERLYIRRFTAGDADDFFSVNGNAEVMKYIRPAKSPDESKAFLEENIRGYERSPLTGRWGMYEKQGNVFVGMFAIIPLENTNNLQLGYALVKEAWYKGYATESALGGVRYAFETLQLRKIMAVTEAGNFASQRVLDKTGFRKVSEMEKRNLWLYAREKPIISIGEDAL